MTDITELEEMQDTQKNKFLTFYVAGEVYALEICRVLEIISIMPVTPLPEFPDYIKGVINLRGGIIPVMDMRLRLRKEPEAYDTKTCIVIIEVNELSIGLIVDSVSEVTFIESGSVVVTPELGNRADGRYVESVGLVGNDIWLILDCDKLIKSDDIDIISNIK
jgi:purine-binding chemotaxis protein CheW